MQEIEMLGWTIRRIISTRVTESHLQKFQRGRTANSQVVYWQAERYL